jgi:glycosidase
VARIRTALSTSVDPHSLTREQQATFVISDSQNRRGALRQRLAAALQFAAPGVPCIYYGDENGMNGFLDPFNRGTFKPEPYALTEDYRRFARLRRSADALRTGHAVFYAPNPDCIAVLRYVADGCDALGRAARDGAYLVVVNRSNSPRRFVLDFMARTPLFDPAHQAALRRLMSGGAVCRITGRKHAVRDGLLEMTVHGLSAVWLEFAVESDESVE